MKTVLLFVFACFIAPAAFGEDESPWLVRDLSDASNPRVANCRQASKITVEDGRVSLFKEEGGKLVPFFVTEDPDAVKAMTAQFGFSQKTTSTVVIDDAGALINMRRVFFVTLKASAEGEKLELMGESAKLGEVSEPERLAGLKRAWGLAKPQDAPPTRVRTILSR